MSFRWPTNSFKFMGNCTQQFQPYAICFLRFYGTYIMFVSRLEEADLMTIQILCRRSVLDIAINKIKQGKNNRFQVGKIKYQILGLKSLINIQT